MSLPASSPGSSPLAAAVQPLTAAWARLQPRERLGLQLAALAVVLLVLWQGLLGPAVRTLATAPRQQAELDSQLQWMQGLASQAAALKAQTPLATAERQAALEQATVQHLGKTATLRSAAGQTTVTLTAAPAAALAPWLADVRANARLTPTAVHIQRVPVADKASPSGVTWQGTVVFTP